MTEIPGKILDISAKEGILAVIVVVLIFLHAGYVYLVRKREAKREDADRQARAERAEKDRTERMEHEQLHAEERRDWREAIDRNTASHHCVERAMTALAARPCLRPDGARTRASDRDEWRE